MSRAGEGIRQFKHDEEKGGVEKSLDAMSAAVIVEKTGKTLGPDDGRVSDRLNHPARHFSALAVVE